jgi:hypothetical protein
MTLLFTFLALAACSGGASDTSATVDSAVDSAVDTAVDTGALTAEDCTSEQVFMNVCTSCGPTDGCEAYEDLCLATCTPEQQWQGCADGGTCMDGVCYPSICG